MVIVDLIPSKWTKYPGTPSWKKKYHRYKPRAGGVNQRVPGSKDC